MCFEVTSYLLKFPNFLIELELLSIQGLRFLLGLGQELLKFRPNRLSFLDGIAPFGALYLEVLQLLAQFLFLLDFFGNLSRIFIDGLLEIIKLELHSLFVHGLYHISKRHEMQEQSDQFVPLRRVLLRIHDPIDIKLHTVANL